jgi:hypothetical protein
VVTVADDPKYVNRVGNDPFDSLTKLETGWGCSFRDANRAPFMPFIVREIKHKGSPDGSEINIKRVLFQEGTAYRYKGLSPVNFILSVTTTTTHPVIHSSV